jgi:hypothetical protein
MRRRRRRRRRKWKFNPGRVRTTIDPPASGSTSTTRPEPSMAPRTQKGQRSRAQIFSISSNDLGSISMAEFSCQKGH